MTPYDIDPDYLLKRANEQETPEGRQVYLELLEWVKSKEEEQK